MIAMDAGRERARVQEHFATVLGELRARDTSGVARATRLVRALVIELLELYAEEGLFPRNGAFPGLEVPAFVDAAGTRCAMAHLIEATGERALVRRIAEERNHAFVRELADEPELVAWLGRAGISLEEAARIQPEYCWVPAECVCGRSNATRPPAAVLEVGFDEAGTCVVLAIHGRTSAYHVGESPRGWCAPGLVAVDANGVILGAVRLDGVDIAQCTLSGPGHEPLTRDQALAAMTSPDCKGVLARIDGSWVQPVGISCEAPDEADLVQGRGCDVAGGGGETGAWIVALVGAVMAARARRAMRAGRG